MTDPGVVRSHRLADLAVAERPREKLLDKGDEYLTDAELIAVALRVGASGRNAIELARDLLAIFDNDLGAVIAGPAKIEEDETTIIVPTSRKAICQPDGCIELTLTGDAS